MIKSSPTLDFVLNKVVKMDSKCLEVLNRHLKVENEHDWPATRETLHPNCFFEDLPFGKTYKGRDEAGVYYHLWWNAFDLITVSEKRHFAENNTVIAEPRYVGTHVGDFYGIKPTGRKIDIKLAVIISFKDGLLSGERFYYDTRTLFDQLGFKAIPILKG